MDYGFFLTVFSTVFIIYVIYILVDDFVVGTEKTIPSITISIPVDISSSEAMKMVSGFIANQNNYRIDYYNLQNRQIILNQRMSFQHFGSLYSIKIFDNQEKSNIVIGISSKLPVVGPWAKKNVEMQLLGLTNAIRANLYFVSGKGD